MKIVDSALVISTRSAEKLERKACEKFRKRIPFVDAFLKHLPIFSECKAVIARRLSESVRWVTLPLLKNSQRFQRGCQCYLFLIVVCGACQLPESQANDLLCGANLTFQLLQDEFQPLPVGSGFATADISESYPSPVFPSLTNPVSWANTLRETLFCPRCGLKNSDWCFRPLARRFVLCTRCRGRVRAWRSIVY